MAYFLFKCWHERLFFIERNNVVNQNTDLPIELVEINRENIGLVRELRGDMYVSQFEHQLSLGDFGYYAFLKGKPVAYGWVKHPNSDDYFFEISEGTRYLCRFFTHESVRGHRVYPTMICSLIVHESECDRFYIGVERGNQASEHGLLKVGFKFFKEFRFIRGFKKTLNKYKMK